MKRKVPLAVSGLLLALAILTCAFGIRRGEMKTVHRKAAAVCLECIGIG
jgi:hypothetical protein